MGDNEVNDIGDAENDQQKYQQQQPLGPPVERFSGPPPQRPGMMPPPMRPPHDGPMGMRPPHGRFPPPVSKVYFFKPVLS